VGESTFFSAKRGSPHIFFVISGALNRKNGSA